MNLFQLLMKKRISTRLRQETRLRQRQKLSGRTIVFMLASFMACIIIGLTIFFNLSRVEKSSAAPKEEMVGEQEFTTEKSLPAPVIISQAGDGNVQLIRKAKEIKSN